MPRNVIGTEWALASSSVSHKTLPSVEEKARKRLSLLAPMKIRPLAVEMPPPMLRAPVFSMPFALSEGVKPSGTFQAMSPVLTFTATSSPKGGAWQGILFSGFQKRPTTPPHGVVRIHVVSVDPRGTPWVIRATCPMFITFVNMRPRSASYVMPFQLPPPMVLGKVTAYPSRPGGV